MALLEQYMKQAERDEQRRLSGEAPPDGSRAVKSILSQPYRPGMFEALGSAPADERPIFVSLVTLSGKTAWS